jgi:cytoskeletal protein RodZ
VGRTLSRVAGVVFAGALATFAAAPAALAQDETSTSPTETTTSTSETSTSSSPTSTTVPASESPASVPSSTSGIATADPAQPEVRTTDKRIAPKAAPEIKGDTQEPSKDDDGYQDNTGHGFVGLGGEGVLVIACAAGKPGEVSTQYLSVTDGPDQDEADGLLWNYSVRVVDAPAGTTTAKFSWTCAGVEGNGIVEFQQEEPPTSTSTSTSTSAAPSSTAPLTTATSTTTTSTAPPGNAAPKAQVKVAPKGGVETGFGGTAW